MQLVDSSSLVCVNPSLLDKPVLNLVNPNIRRDIRVQTTFLIEGSKRHQYVEYVVVAGYNHNNPRTCFIACLMWLRVGNEHFSDIMNPETV